MHPTNDSGDFGNALLSSSLLRAPSSLPPQKPAAANSGAQGAGMSSRLQPADVFPDTYDEEDDCMEDSASNGLTLLPTAQYSDDEDEDDGGGLQGIYHSLNALLPKHAPNAATSSVFADARVVCDPHTGQATLLRSTPTPFSMDERGDEYDLSPADAALKLTRVLTEPLDAVREGQHIANIIGHKSVASEMKDKAGLAARSLAIFGPEEQYRAYQAAIDRQAQLDEEMAHSKRQKHDHSAATESLVSPLPNPISTASARSREPQQFGHSKYSLPPESGDFITCRNARGKSLYFALRSDIDLSKQADRIASLRGDARMSSSQVNRVVADIETELDTALALRDSERDMEMLDLADTITSTQSTRSIPKPVLAESRLWVDKYRAQTFLDLVSDERTNRAVMQWLKEWDFCVFGRESAAAKRPPTHARSSTKDSAVHFENKDKWKRPQRRILLLSGPPGLGKTTLAHVVARQAGYGTVEINASDDRTAAKIKDRVLGVTQTHSVGMTAGSKPQLLIIDEVDGASAAQSAQGDFISMLVKLATNAEEKGAPTKKRRGDQRPLLRPIICICNNVYAPVLRPLRQIAQCYHVYPPTSARLAKRLEEVCETEGVAADSWGLVELAKQNEGDIRSCLNSLQIISARAQKVDSDCLKTASIGVKDVQRSLFAIWAMLFTRPDASSLTFSRSARSSLGKRNANGHMGNASIDREYSRMILDSIRSSGEHERLMQGCFENYLRMEFRDLTHTKVSSLCSDWFEFYDLVDTTCRKNPSGSEGLFAYLDYPLLAVHRTCSTPMGLSRGDFEYPHSEFEAFQGRQAALGIIQSLMSSATSARTQSTLTVNVVALDLLDYLLHILSPQLVTSNKHLLKGEERNRLYRLVEVMNAWELSLVQNKDDNGQFIYRLEPPIDRLFGFTAQRPSRPIMPMRYPVRQLVSQELEILRVAHLAAKSSTEPSDISGAADAKELSKRDYLTKLFADPLAPAKKCHAVDGEGDELSVKDFFGRIVTKKKASASPLGGPNKEARKARDGVGASSRAGDSMGRSHEWFHFFEGFSNAVSKPTQVKELL